MEALLPLTTASTMHEAQCSQASRGGKRIVFSYGSHQAMLTFGITGCLDKSARVWTRFLFLFYTTWPRFITETTVIISRQLIIMRPRVDKKLVFTQR
jgi:hypothetical protein